MIRQIDEEGYEYVLGPGAPEENGEVSGLGLYCKNYREIAEKEKAAKAVKMD